jgi:dihydrofolate synthase/folylpolyglutamate synthase
MHYFDALKTICQPVSASDYPRSLTPMRHLLNALDDPQRQFPSVVVAGSVGKGMTCHHIARLLRSAGLKVGLYTSPHLHSFRERFSIDGNTISQETFIEGVTVVREAVKEARERTDNPGFYSTFEQATGLALWWFAQQDIDIAVLEIGLGGRWDAVNAVPNALAVFTPIESEHVAMLGGSLQTIAWRKAGIIRNEGYAITGRQSATVMTTLQHETSHKRAVLLRTDAGQDAYPQESAAFLAVAAYQNLLSRKIISRNGFFPSTERISLPGRLEQVKVNERDVLIDGGHTPLAAKALRDTIDHLVRPYQRVRLVIGMLQDKAAGEYLSEFDSPQFHLILTQAPGHRALTPQALLERARLEEASIQVEPDLSDALDELYADEDSLFVVAGSLRMAAAAREAYGLLPADEVAEARATRAIFEGDEYLAKLRLQV